MRGRPFAVHGSGFLGIVVGLQAGASGAGSIEGGIMLTGLLAGISLVVPALLLLVGVIV